MFRVASEAWRDPCWRQPELRCIAVRRSGRVFRAGWMSGADGAVRRCRSFRDGAMYAGDGWGPGAPRGVEPGSRRRAGVLDHGGAGVSATTANFERAARARWESSAVVICRAGWCVRKTLVPAQRRRGRLPGRDRLPAAGVGIVITGTDNSGLLRCCADGAARQRSAIPLLVKRIRLARHAGRDPGDAVHTPCGAVRKQAVAAARLPGERRGDFWRVASLAGGVMARGRAGGRPKSTVGVGGPGAQSGFRSDSNTLVAAG